MSGEVAGYSLEDEVDPQLLRQAVERQVLAVEAHVGEQVELVPVVVEDGGRLAAGGGRRLRRQRRQQTRVLPARENTLYSYTTTPHNTPLTKKSTQIT